MGRGDTVRVWLTCIATFLASRTALAAPDGRDEYSPLEARLALGLSPACDDAAAAFGHLEAAAALGAGGARHARRAGARLAARDAKRFDAILASLAANDARAAVDALARAVRGAAERAAFGERRRSRRITMCLEYIMCSADSSPGVRRGRVADEFSLRLRLVTSRGPPYPSRSPRAHPSGWTRTQFFLVSYRGR